MASMQMERTSHDHSINVLQIEQAAMVVERLDSLHHLAGLIAATSVDIGDGRELSIGNSDKLLQKFLAPPAATDHAYKHTIVCAQQPEGWLHHEGRRYQSGVLS